MQQKDASLDKETDCVNGSSHLVDSSERSGAGSLSSPHCIFFVTYMIFFKLCFLATLFKKKQF